MSLNNRLSLTLVIPTRHEADNIIPLLAAIKQHVPHGTAVIFVDDSDNNGDATVETILAARPVYLALQIRLIHRESDERNGLSGAVIRGIESASSDLVLVMDADLQHPPETIPAMITAAYKADVVIASRYCPGGNASGLHSPLRHAVSRVCTCLAKALFTDAMHQVSDPMSGCFAVHRALIDTGRLQPAGFKVLLEILVRHPELMRAQVPIKFATRANGVSKSNLKVGKQFLYQLLRLRFTHLARQLKTLEV